MFEQKDTTRSRAAGRNATLGGPGSGRPGCDRNRGAGDRLERDVHAQRTWSRVSRTQSQNVKQSQDVLSQRLAQAEETNAQMRGELSVVTDRLKLTQGELSSARKYAKQVKEEDQKKLEAMQSDVTNQLATKASADDLKSTNGDVAGVKSDLEGTKSNLQMARGETGYPDRPQP